MTAQLALPGVDIRSSDEHARLAEIHRRNQRRAEERGCPTMARIFGRLADQEAGMVHINDIRSPR